MQERLKHLVFYDGTCGLCDYFVQILLKIDRNQIFAFAPLQGKTAEQLLSTFPEEKRQIDSIILVENYRSLQSLIYMRAKALFRVFWLLGGPWVFIGWLFFLPSSLFDWAYRLVARYRYRLFSQRCLIPQKDLSDRFLP